jgi:undecaprenyl-diphosphatase
MMLGMLIYFVLHNVSSRPLKTALVLVFAFIILLVGYSRVYLGDHWLSEVIESYFIAGGFLLLMTVLYEQIKESHIRRQKVHEA